MGSSGKSVVAAANFIQPETDFKKIKKITRRLYKLPDTSVRIIKAKS